MKTIAIISTVLLSLLVLDTAHAVGIRRTAVVVRGPQGGVAVAASRTAIVRPFYGFALNHSAAEKAGNHLTQLAKAASEKTCEPSTNALRASH
jgi:hypothetical protein